MSNQNEKPVASRRRFLSGAAAATAGAAAVGFPMIGRTQGPIVIKMQGAWGAKDIFNEMAQEYVTRVNEMAGGRLRIDYLVAGAVVKPFEVMDATSKGVLDACHSVPVYWYGKSKVASLFGSGPINGCDAHQTLAWIYRGGGLALYNELLGKINLDCVGFFAMPMPTQPLGWFKKPIKDAAGLKGLKYRTVGLAADLFQQMGTQVTQLPGGEIIPALEKGVIDAFEFNNPTSDSRFGAQDVIKNYMMGSYHQAMEFFEIAFNKKKWATIPKDLQAILQYAAEAASSANWWTAMDNYSRDLQELKDKHKVNVIRTPKSIMAE
jgi:TRAP-type mannitol/chloroaromatic compound transport system substrate-binding protein